jgi:hypothetical protein
MSHDRFESLHPHISEFAVQNDILWSEIQTLWGGIYYTRVVHRLNNEFMEDIQVVL